MYIGAVLMIVKHKKKNPWETHTEGTCKKRMVPESFNEKEYRAHIDADIFMWNIFWSLDNNHPYNTDKIVNEFWYKVYRKPFPEEGGTLEELFERIYSRLIDRGHDSQRIEPKESDYNLPVILEAIWQTAKDKNILKLNEEELEMARATKKTTKTTTKPDEKKATKKATPVATVSSGDAPAWITGSKPGTKAHESKVKVCELLLERKYSDEEIALMVESEIEYKITPDRVGFYRRTLNKGQFEPIGYPAPEEPVQPIENDGGSAPAKKPAKTEKAAGKATNKPAKKPAGKKPIVAKKKLVIKKKK